MTAPDRWIVVTPNGEDGTQAALVERPCIVSLGRIIGSFDQLADAQRAVEAVNASSDAEPDLHFFLGAN